METITQTLSTHSSRSCTTYCASTLNVGNWKFQLYSGFELRCLDTKSTALAAMLPLSTCIMCSGAAPISLSPHYLIASCAPQLPHAPLSMVRTLRWTPADGTRGGGSRSSALSAWPYAAPLRRSTPPCASLLKRENG